MALCHLPTGATDAGTQMIQMPVLPVWPALPASATFIQPPVSRLEARAWLEFRANSSVRKTCVQPPITMAAITTSDER